MKKLLLILTFLFFYSCKETIHHEKSKIQAININSFETLKNRITCPITNNCSSQILIFHNSTEQINWLKENYHNICECDLYNQVFAAHEITEKRFKELFSQGNYDKSENLDNAIYNNKNFKGINWEDLKAYTGITNKYDAYLFFKVINGDTTDNDLSNDYELKPILQSDFSSLRTCYSLPFLLSIEYVLNYQKVKPLVKEMTKFYFYLVDDTVGREKLIFKVEVGSVTYFFDISDDPKRKNNNGIEAL